MAVTQGMSRHWLSQETAKTFPRGHAQNLGREKWWPPSETTRRAESWKLSDQAGRKEGIVQPSFSRAWKPQGYLEDGNSISVRFMEAGQAGELVEGEVLGLQGGQPLSPAGPPRLGP